MRKSGLLKIRLWLLQLINDQVKLPKAIILVLDNDLIRFANRNDELMLVEIMEHFIHHIAKDLQQMIQDYKEMLPLKAKKEGFPRILWVESPLHRNFEDNHLRIRYNSCLQNVLDSYPMVMPIKMKKEWNPASDEHFNHNRFSSSGLIKYWASIDSSFRHWETVVSRNKKFRESIYGKPPQLGQFQDSRVTEDNGHVGHDNKTETGSKDDNSLSDRNDRRGTGGRGRRGGHGGYSRGYSGHRFRSWNRFKWFNGCEYRY